MWVDRTDKASLSTVIARFSNPHEVRESTERSVLPYTLHLSLEMFPLLVKGVVLQVVFDVSACLDIHKIKSKSTLALPKSFPADVLRDTTLKGV
jgi:hypothetical protein